MKIHFRKVGKTEFNKILFLLKEAAEQLKSKEIDQWGIWLNPSDDKINWIKKGFDQEEFYFVETEDQEVAGMFRLSSEDLLYWGKNNDNAKYVHSLVVKKKFSGQQLGEKIIHQLEQNLINQHIDLFRLDCNAANKWLCKYYENLSFIKVGEIQMTHSLNNLYEKNLKKQ
jgi:ribosomal protein S18 acetylase RimI-like enzyme